MKSLWIKERIAYDGSQLRSLYAYLNHDVAGDSVIAWRGPCHVSLEHMVDGEDRLANARIAGGDMVHFIVERFGESLSYAVAAQRLIAAIVKDLIAELSPKRPELRRDGDDIYRDDGKFSISIATVSPVSALIHFAVNVSNEGTPVQTCSLADFSVDADMFIPQALERIAAELESMVAATQKVHWVK